MSIVIRINACKKFFTCLCPCHSTIVVIIFGVSLAILVMAPVEAVFLGELECIMLFGLIPVLLLTIGSDSQRKHILKL